MPVTFPAPGGPAMPQTPAIPGMPSMSPAPSIPGIPQAPSMPGTVPSQNPSGPTGPTNPPGPAGPTAPMLPPTPPESEQAFPLSPLLPKVLPYSPNITVPLNPLLPPNYATTLDYESLQYMNGYLRTQIGNYVEAKFLVGSTNITTMAGRLVGVGLNYILIEDVTNGHVSACDFYTIKFFTTHSTGAFNLLKL